MKSVLRISAAVVALCLAGASLAEESWTLAKDAEGIKVYTRSVAGSQLREFKGEVDLPTTVEGLVRVLRDVGAFRKWMPDVVRCELLASSEKEQYHYMENAAPWPVSNRDGVYRFTFGRVEDGDAPGMLVRVQAFPAHVPGRAGKVRVPKSDGFWKILATGKGVKLIYQIHADPGGSIPSWLANSAVVSTPWKTLKNLRSHIQSLTP